MSYLFPEINLSEADEIFRSDAAEGEDPETLKQDDVIPCLRALPGAKGL
jgi:hypothetical protein